MKRLAPWLLLAAALGATPALSPARADEAAGWPGRLAGSHHWRMPATPNGLQPTQSWHATGSTPGGDIYVGGMDHATNSALYRLDAARGTLRYVGDARTASEAAGNWVPGETAQKFHTRPLWHDGKVWVATMDRSTLDDQYLSRRGFHWYAYDPAGGSFRDMSATEPGGTGAPHGALVALASDPERNLIYGAGVPTGALYRYDVAAGRTEELGRPAAYDKPYLYADRVLWLDSRGRVYFTAGHPQTEPSDPLVYGHVRYFDPATGFGEEPGWRLREPRALEVGQCLPAPRRCFLADDQGFVYRFDDTPAAWTSLGKAATVGGEYWVWLFDVSADGREAYLATSSWGEDANPASLYEFDLATGRTARLCSLAELDPALGPLNLHTGYDAWDADGRFYFTSFALGGKDRVVVTRIDPVRLKAALGLLPGVVEIGVEPAVETGADGARRAFTLTRSGDTAQPQEVLYRLAFVGADGVRQERQETATIPSGAASLTVELGRSAGGTSVTLIPNGDDYVVAAKHSAGF
jgi:hypothetical protein